MEKGVFEVFGKRSNLNTMLGKRIVAIHAVGDKTFTCAHLEAYIRSMKWLGYDFVSLRRILSPECGRRSVALTVDDGYKSSITHLMPILRKYGVKACMFVATGLMGLPANHKVLIEHRCYPNEDIMSLAELRLWLSEGHEVGFHTDMHLDLRETPYEQAAEDFRKGMLRLREWGVETDLFAYPFGYLPGSRRDFEQLLEKSGCKYAFTIDWGDVDTCNPYYIDRVCLGDHEPYWWSVLKTVGLVDWYRKCHS